jgi:hypothetical protein
MWQVRGNHINAGLFEPFEPVEVLYDFDGPRTFTHKDSAGQMCLAHWCDADRDFNRFIVVPFTDSSVQRLKSGEITLADVLDQPCVWVLDVAHSGDIREAWGVKLADLPADVLPKPGTMLWLSLERLEAQGTAQSRPSLARQTAGMIPWTGDAETLERIATDPEFGIGE